MEPEHNNVQWIVIENSEVLSNLTNTSTSSAWQVQNEAPNVEVIEQNSAQPSTSRTTQQDSSSSSAPTVVLEGDLTQKFLRGEITFAEYSSEWYDQIQEDEDNADKEEEDRRQTSSRSLESRPSCSIASDSGFKKKRRSHLSLSPALLGLMGEANIRFVRGEHETAEKMCHEIIRQVPTAYEPYQTLAQIYENDPEKNLQYSLLAAHLSPPDADEWLRLAEVSKQRKEVKQEMICYTHAIRANPRNLSLHLKRLDLVKQLEEINYPLHILRISYPLCYHKIVKSLPATEAVTILDYAKKAAKLYHNSNEIEKALEVMKDAYNKCAMSFSLEELNLLLELLISMKLYRECIDVFISNTGIEVEAIVQTIAEGDSVHEQTQFVACRIPEKLPIDLNTKLIVCFVHLKANEIVSELMPEFLENDIEKAGDLYMDVEEALSAVGEHTMALHLLELLVKSEHYSLGAVWLRHAECLINLGRESEAVNSLKKVIELAPQHVEARRKLFSILEQNGLHIDAMNILEQDYTKPINSKLMYEHCQVLKDQGNLEKFLEVGERLLSRTFMRYRHPEELKMARYMRSTHVVTDNIYNFRAERGEDPYDPEALVFETQDILTPDEEWVLLQDLIEIAFDLKKYVVMERLCFGAYTSKLITNRRPEVEFLCLQACLLNKDYQNAYPLVKELVTKFSDCPRAWNLYSLVQQSDDQNQTKNLMRMYERFKGVPQLKMFVGNTYMTSGRYQMALRYYQEYHEANKDPITALLIGVTLLVMGCQRSVDKHHSLILQGISYLFIYKDLRKYDQEAYYNIGRAYHMLGLNNLAVHYYEKALASPSVECKEHGKVDVIRETAFNLHLLYQNNSPHLARMILQKYLVF